MIHRCPRCVCVCVCVCVACEHMSMWQNVRLEKHSNQKTNSTFRPLGCISDPRTPSLTSSPPDPVRRSCLYRWTPLSRRWRYCRCCCRPCASSLRRPPAAAGPRTTRTSFPDPSVCPVSHLDASVRSSQSHLSLSCLVCPSSRPLPSFLSF